MIRTDFVSLRVNEHERELLKTLARVEERTESDVLRRLVREAARARGIALVEPSHAQEPQKAA